MKRKFLFNRLFTSGAASLCGASFMALCLLFAASCSNILAPPKGQQNAAGEGNVVISLDGNMRTMLPTLNHFSRKTLAFTPRTPGLSAPDNIVFTGTSRTVSLGQGDWTVTVQSHFDIGGGEYRLTAQGQADFTVTPGNVVTVQVSLSIPPGSTGTGTFNYTAVLPPLPFDSAKIYLYPLAGTEGDKEIDLLSRLSGAEPLASGYYLVRTVVECRGIKVGKVEALHVYPDTSVSASYEFSSRDFTEQKLLIWQAYGTGQETDGAVSHSFVELYNPTNQMIGLSGYSLHYSHVERTNLTGNPVYPDDYEQSAWQKLNLSGSIPARSSFLILGKEMNTVNLGLDLKDITPNQVWTLPSSLEEIAFSNRSLMLCLLSNTNDLNDSLGPGLNPFNIDGDGTRVPGYVDMFGGINGTSSSSRDIVYGFEGPEPVGGWNTIPVSLISKQRTARRNSIVDSDNTLADFESIDYQVGRATGLGSRSYGVYRPRSSGDGAWDPVAIPEILILQAHGTGTAPGGAVSHSFVELYNPGADPVPLTGYSLHYSESGANWDKINLTGTIKAGHSYLIRGAEVNSGALLNLAGKTPDMNWPAKVFSSAAFKVALIRGTGALSVTNPFNSDGVPVAGYVDMLGAGAIDAYETAGIAGISGDAAARRKTIQDKDNNSIDFDIIDYSESNDKTEWCSPRSGSDPQWDPDPGYIPPPPPATVLILQAYGTGDGGSGNVSHSFVELYNVTDAPINLSGYSLQYAEGTRTDPPALTDGLWEKIDLSGTIPAKRSFLILGDKRNPGARLQIEDDYGDINDDDFVLGNRSFKVVLLQSTTLLTQDIQNPNNTDGAWGRVSGFVDLVGAVNNLTATPPDQILGYLGTPARNSSQEAIRRNKLDNFAYDNSLDYSSVRYEPSGTGIRDWEIEFYRPKNSAYVYGSDNFSDPMDKPAGPVLPPDVGSTLMIFQLGAPNSSGSVSHSFIELYNNGNAPVDLSTYSLQYAAASTAPGADDGPWAKIDLSGTIPPRHSFLVRGNLVYSAAPQQIEEGDITAPFALHNRGAKLILLSNQNLIQTVLTDPLQDNPFDLDGEGTKVPGYVDMVGAVNEPGVRDFLNAYETNIGSRLTGSQALRRLSVVDTDDNAADFGSVDYRTGNISAPDREIKRPKNLAYGAWNPITGSRD